MKWEQQVQKEVNKDTRSDLFEVTNRDDSNHRYGHESHNEGSFGDEPRQHPQGGRQSRSSSDQDAEGDEESQASYMASDARKSEISDDLAAKSFKTFKTFKSRGQKGDKKKKKKKAVVIDDN